MADGIGDTPWISFVGRAGGQHVCFVGVAGSATLGTVCSGLNDAGQLGDGTTTDRLSADVGGLVTLSGADLYALSVGGGKHTCTVDSGVLWCWGSNSAGQLGPNGPGSGVSPCPAGACSRVPITVPVPVEIAEDGLTLGGQHTCILSTEGDAYCWGDDSAGQLGDGSPGGFRSTPQPAAPGLRFSVLSAGDTHTCGVSLSGTLYCWGANGDSRLGSIGGTNGSIPLRVLEPLGG
jgi:alpha-tubulin suppressor-like RCC1 family protein